MPPDPASEGLTAALQREAATREILEVISQSRDDETPVFDAIRRNALKLCDAAFAGVHLGRRGDTYLRMAATTAPDTPLASLFTAAPRPMDRDQSFAARSIIDGQVVHIPDLAASDLYLQGADLARMMVDKGGVRAMLMVPLLLQGEAVGAISLHRLVAEPFTPSQIELAQSFAAQAVIAIENVRQFRELQARLEREAATREILEVISQSRDDETPVFDAVLRLATRLCRGDGASLVLGKEGDTHIRIGAATSGVDPATVAVYDRGEVKMNPKGSHSAQAILSGKVVPVNDLMDTEGYRRGYGLAVSAVRDSGIRTMMFVPLLTPSGGIGCLNILRREVLPFTADEVALLETFAAQAVIAIENVQQFKALEALNAELGERVQAQVGVIERMGRLKRFLPAAVADAVVSSGSDKMLSSHRALLGVLFCDIRGFTAFCETAEPEETIEVLQTYHEEMGRLIEAHGAGVDHRMGDGIMVLFNDPLPCDDPAGAAVRLALAMRDRMAELCARWKKMGHRLGFGVGISLGYATVGMVGSGGRHDYTASGTAVNLAARLCDEAQDGEILISPRAAAAVEGSFAVEGRGERSLKGIREPEELFRVTGVAGA